MYASYVTIGRRVIIMASLVFLATSLIFSVTNVPTVLSTPLRTALAAPLPATELAPQP
jgi:hypothetical protein